MSDESTDHVSGPSYRCRAKTSNNTRPTAPGGNHAPSHQFGVQSYLEVARSLRDRADDDGIDGAIRSPGSAAVIRPRGAMWESDAAWRGPTNKIADGPSDARCGGGAPRRFARRVGTRVQGAAGRI